MNTEHILLVCGDRNWQSKERIARVLNKYSPNKTILIVGGARGADMIAQEYALARGFNPITMYAAWKAHGKAAGPIRNRAMLKLLMKLQFACPQATVIVHAFHDRIRQSKGTRDMIRLADANGFTVKLHTSRR